MLQIDKLSKSPIETAPWLLRDDPIAELIRAVDWAATPLGPLASWEPCLRSSLALALASQTPTFITWGPTQLVFCNSPFAASFEGARSLLFVPLAEALNARHPALLEAHRRALDGISSSLEGVSFAEREVPWSAFLVPIRDENGAVRGVFTSLLRSRAASPEPRLLDRLPIPLVVTFGREHEYELANGAWHAAFGGAPRTGSSLLELYPELASTGFFEALDEAWTTSKRKNGVVLRLPVRDAGGGYRHGDFECSFEPLLDDTGAADRIAVFATEVTELVAARQNVEQSERHRNEFLAMLAHELRNPLAPIRTALHLLKRKDPNGLSRHLQIVDRQTENLTHLVDDLLDVSRITRGKIELRRERVDLASVLARSLDAVRGAFERRSIDLAVTLPDAPLFVQGDPVRLEQVVVNLLTNAAKYTHQSGHVRVSVDRTRAMAELRVADDGIGIPAELLPRVFNLFQQAQQALDRASGGLGIGLTLVRSLVELHGGEISAQSAGPGRGSEFVVRLPVLEPSVTLLPPPPEPSSHPSGRQTRVLVVDDNVDAADTIADLLREVGHSVRVCHSGRLALDAAAEFEPEVVLLDIGLPEMDGYEVASSIRRSSSKPPALIALTGYGQASDRDRSRDAGFAEHLVKPVRLETLIEILDRCDASPVSGA